MKTQFGWFSLCLMILGTVTLGCGESTPADSETSNGENNVDANAGDVTDNPLADGTTQVEVDANDLPCEGEECDSFHYCKSDSDCEFLLEQLPKCSAVSCNPDSKICMAMDDPIPGCLAPTPPDNAICVLEGQEGERLSCDIRVARANGLVPGPTGMTLTIEYPTTVLRLAEVGHYPCGDPEVCDAIPVPENALSSGGSVTLKPETTTEWDGLGLITLESSPDAPETYVTEAVKGAGADTLITLTFELPAALQIPVWATLTNPTATGLPGSELTADMVDGVVIVNGEPIGEICDPLTDPGCDETIQSPACAMVGAPGEEVRCDVELVRASTNDGRPVGGSISLEYDKTLLTLVRFEAQDCELSNCTQLDLPEDNLATGHSVTLDPAVPTDWSGFGTLTVASPIENVTPITEVALDASGTPDGPALFFTAVFVLNAEATADQPALMGLGKGEFIGAENAPLNLTQEEARLIVSGAQQCPFGPNCGGPITLPLPENALCALSGSAGEFVDCPLRLVRSDMESLPATSLQFGLQHDTTVAVFEGVYAENCYDAIGCLEESVVGPGAKTLPTGHSFTTAPLTPDSWEGEVLFILSNISNPSGAITDAYQDINGANIGETAFATARFQLQIDIPVEGPLYVNYEPSLFSGSAALPLEAGGQVYEVPIQAIFGTMVSGPQIEP